MLIVGRQSFLERRDGFLEVFTLIGVLALNVRVDARRHRVLTSPDNTRVAFHTHSCRKRLSK